MQKYTIVAFLQPTKEGTVFTATEWPLHMKIVAGFILNLDAEALVPKLTETLEGQKHIRTTADDYADFGPNGQTRVTLVHPTPELMALHNTLVQRLSDLGAVFDEPRYMTKGFRPHATVQKAGRLHPHDGVVIDKLALVDMAPHDNAGQVEVLQTFTFGS